MGVSWLAKINPRCPKGSGVFFDERIERMQMIKIDDKEYDFDALSPDVKSQIQSLNFVDAELGRLSAQIAVFKTARLAYVKALNQALLPPTDPLAKQLAGDTIKLS